MLVTIHQTQELTFFFVISHMAVNAEAEASASAQGIAPGANEFLIKVSAINITRYMAEKKPNSAYNSVFEELVILMRRSSELSFLIQLYHPYKLIMV